MMAEWEVRTRTSPGLGVRVPPPTNHLRDLFGFVENIYIYLMVKDWALGSWNS